mgnify:FL=1
MKECPMLSSAIGTTEPTQDRIDELHRIFDDIRAAPDAHRIDLHGSYPSGCMDGRPFMLKAEDSPSGKPEPAPPRVRVPGGSLATWVADLLLVGAFCPEGFTGWDEGEDPLPADVPEQCEAWISNLFSTLRESGIEVCVHSSEKVGEDDFGCGAMDGLKTALRLMIDSREEVEALMRSWGLDPAELPAAALARAERLRTVLPPGARLGQACTPWVSAPIPLAMGEHRELVLVANAQPGTSVNSDGLVDVLGGQAFVIDIWSFEVIAQTLMEAAKRRGSGTNATRDGIVAVLAAFSASALLALCGPNIEVVLLPARS